MRKLLLCVCLLIIYGSIYPFEFSLQYYDKSQLDNLLYFGLAATPRGDLIANILLFLPFGILAIRIISTSSKSILLSWLAMLFSGFVLAYGLQVAQLVIPGRTPSGADALWNMVGCLVGAVIGSFIIPKRFTIVGKISQGMPIPTALALLWVLSNWAPFVPSLDLQLLKDSIKSILYDPSANGVWIYQNTLMWIVAFYFLALSGALLKERYYPLVVLGVLAGSLFFANNMISLDRILGGVLALPIWYLCKRFLSPRLLAFFLLLAITAINFTPFELRSTPIDFQWVPFYGALEGNLVISVMATFKKSIIYASIIWLLVESRLSLRYATIATSAFLLVSEFLQIFFYNATPEITDSLIALGIGVVMYRYLLIEKSPVSAPNSSLEGGGHTFATHGTVQRPKQKNALASSNPMSLGHIAAMDGLRALAAMAVFFVHFNQIAGLEATVGPFDLNRYLANGNTGVALFFTLSGLLLSAPFWQAKIREARFPSIRAYTWRRAARILPAYYLCLFLILLGKSLAGSGTSWNNILSHLIFIYNISDWNILSLNQPFWTLAVEVQFYVLLPLLFLALRKLTSRSTFIVFIGLIPALYFLNHLFVTSLQNHAHWPINQLFIWPFAFYLRGPDSWVLTYSTLAHLPHFLIGVVSARIFLKLADAKNGVKASWFGFEMLVWFCAVAVFVVLATPLDDILQIPNGRYNFPVVPLLVAVIVVCIPYTRLARFVLENSLFVWLGAISYGIYIYHYPVQKIVVRGMDLLDISVSEHVLLFGLSSLAITLVCSQISYTLVEVPALRWVRGHLGGGVKVVDAGPRPRSLPKSQELGQEQPASEISSAAAQNSFKSITTVGSDMELFVNLRQNQIEFLNLISDETGMSPPLIFGALLDEAVTSEPASSKLGLLDSNLRKAASDAFGYLVDSEEWERVAVVLSSEHIDRLDAMSKREGRSYSGTLRKILSSYMSACHEAGISATLPKTSVRTGYPRQGNSTSLRVVAGFFVLVLIVVGVVFLLPDKGVSIRQTVPWAGSESSVVMDMHTHTTDSDGARPIEEVVRLGLEAGCDALAITDHSSRAAGSKSQFAAIDKLRARYPQHRIFLGVELDMPSYGGREHANVLVHPTRERDIIPTLRDTARQGGKIAGSEGENLNPDGPLLDLVARYRKSGDDVFLVYNHPSRKVEDTQESLHDLENWNAKTSSFNAMEGAPGHQADTPTGSYSTKFETIDRWDPVAAETGGVWDQYLSEGHQLWGALASSDYHNDNMDLAPCEFSRIHLSVPDNSYEGILKSLLAGTFWSDHGRIVDQLQFFAEMDGLDNLVYPGEVVDVRSRDAVAQISLVIRRGPGSKDSPLYVEFISSCLTGDAQLLSPLRLDSNETTATSLLPLMKTGSDGESCIVRARVRLKQITEPDLLAYTNPIRFYL